MGKTIILTCDICGGKIKEHDYYKVKVRSPYFVNYITQETLFADRKSIYVCGRCARLFTVFVTERKENHVKEKETNS